MGSSDEGEALRGANSSIRETLYTKYIRPFNASGREPRTWRPINKDSSQGS